MTRRATEDKSQPWWVNVLGVGIGFLAGGTIVRSCSEDPVVGLTRTLRDNQAQLVQEVSELREAIEQASAPARDATKGPNIRPAERVSVEAGVDPALLDELRAIRAALQALSSTPGPAVRGAPALVGADRFTAPADPSAAQRVLVLGGDVPADQRDQHLAGEYLLWPAVRVLETFGPPKRMSTPDGGNVTWTYRFDDGRTWQNTTFTLQGGVVVDVSCSTGER